MAPHRVGRPGKSTGDIHAYVIGVSVQHLEDLKPLLMTEFEEDSGYVLANSEAVRRIIFNYWKLKVGDKKNGQAPIQNHN